MTTGAISMNLSISPECTCNSETALDLLNDCLAKGLRGDPAALDELAAYIRHYLAHIRRESLR